MSEETTPSMPDQLWAHRWKDTGEINATGPMTVTWTSKEAADLGICGDDLREALESVLVGIGPAPLVKALEGISRLDALLAEARAEVAALKARPAMAWRRREEGEELPVGSHLAMLRGRPAPWAIDYRGGDSVFTGRLYASVRLVTHYIPWSDLTPPGGEDAS